jgi:hypothetical protein
VLRGLVRRDDAVGRPRPGGPTLRRRCSATSGERGRHDRLGLRPTPRLARWSSHKRADAADVVADLSTGVTNSEPSSRIDSYHPNETSQVRPRDERLASVGRPVGVPYRNRGCLRLWGALCGALPEWSLSVWHRDSALPLSGGRTLAGREVDANRECASQMRGRFPLRTIKPATHTGINE